MNSSSALRILGCIITLSPWWAIEASLDTKHTAEYRSSLSAASAALACASTATATQPVSIFDETKKKREELFKKHSGLVRSIVPCAGSASEKIAAFLEASDRKDTRALYDMAHDPDIAAHVRDKKIVLTTIVDAQEKTTLEHAIENNDAQFAQTHIQALSFEQRQKMVRYAAQCERPQIVLALLPEESVNQAYAEASQSNSNPRQRTYFRARRGPPTRKTTERILKNYFYAIQDLTISEYATYQNALALAREVRIQNAWKIANDIANQTKFPLEVAIITTQMLHPNIQLHKTKDQVSIIPLMHPELENAIISGNDKDFDRLVAIGWLNDDRSRKGLDALSLAVHHGQLPILKKLIAQVPFVSKQRRCELKKIAEEQASYRKQRPSHDREAQEELQRYQNIIQFIDADWRENTEKNDALVNAFDAINTGAFLQALESGANPNIMVNDNTGGNPHLFLYWTIFDKKPEYTQLLLDAGADPNELDSNGVPIILKVFNDITFFRMCSQSKNFNPNIRAENNDGEYFPLLYWAIEENKPEHAQLLLDAGADPNAKDAQGYPIILETFYHNAAFLKMLLDKGASIDMVIKLEDEKIISLVEYAERYSTPEHVRLLQDAQAEREYIYACA